MEYIPGDKPARIRELQELGKEEVRRRLLAGDYGDKGAFLHEVAQEWLDAEELATREASEARAERREEAMLSAAKEANRVASQARSDARRANLIAIIAIIIAAIDINDLIIKIWSAVIVWFSSP